MANERLYDMEARLVGETEFAVKLEVGGRGGDKHWFPKRVAQDNGDGTWTVPEEMAVEKGIV